jgi:hypothetical protein
MEALNRGNGAQANQIWLHMDADSRAGFAHSEGMQPVQGAVSSDEIKKRIAQHYADKMGAGEDDANVEDAAPHVGSGGLESLPEYTGPSGAMPQTVTVPDKTQPSN